MYLKLWLRIFRPNACGGNKKCTNDLPTHPLIFNRAIDTNIVKNRSIWTDTSNFACFGAFIEKM